MSGPLKAGLLLLVVFTAGMASGVVLSDTIEEWPIPGVPAERKDLDDDIEDVVDAEAEMVRKLSLTDDQQTRIFALLEARDRELVGYWSQRIPDMQRIMERTRSEIRVILNPQQLAEYEAGLRELQSERAAAQR